MNWTPKIEYTDMATGTIKQFTFDFPPSGDPFSEVVDHDVKQTVSNNGQRQYQYNFGRQIFAVSFQFQSQSVKSDFEYFFNKHGVKGGKFKYYPSSDDTQYFDVELDIDSIKYERIIPGNTPGTFLFDLAFKFSRIL